MAHVLTYSEINDFQSLRIGQGSRLSGRLGLGLLASTAAVLVTLFGLPVFSGFF